MRSGAINESPSMGAEQVLRDDDDDEKEAAAAAAAADQKLKMGGDDDEKGEAIRDDDDEENNKKKKKKKKIKRMMWGREKSFKLRSESLNWLRLRRVFDLFDKNGDGVITMDEITQALVLLGLITRRDDDSQLEDDDDDDDDEDDLELQAIVTSFIRPGNQGLDFQDFQALYNSFFHTTTIIDHHHHPDHEDKDEDDKDQQQEQQQQQQQQQQVESDLKEAFKVFDSDGDGFISATELQQVLSKLGFPEAQQELHHIQLMISSFDHNHDGHVDFFEFKLMMSRTLLLPSPSPSPSP